MTGLSSTEATPAPTTGMTTARGRWVVPTLVGTTFASATGTLAFGPLLPLIAADLGVGAARLGQIPALAALVGAAFALGIGPLADRHGHARALVLALLVFAAATLGAALAPGYAALLAALLLAAPAQTAISPAALALAGARFAGEARRRAIGWITAGVSGAAIVGVPLLTAVAALAGWRAAFGALAALAVAGAALARAVLGARAGDRPAPARPHAFPAAYRPLLRHRPTLALLGANVLGRAGTAALTTYLGAFFVARHGLTAREIGSLYLALGLGMLAGTAAFGGRLGRLPLVPALLGTRAGAGALVAAALLLPLPAAAAAALLTLAMTCVAAATVAAATLLADVAPGGQATAMALNGTAMQLGAAFGGASGGLALALAGYPALATGILVLYCAASALLWSVWPRRPGVGATPEPATGVA